MTPQPHPACPPPTHATTTHLRSVRLRHLLAALLAASLALTALVLAPANRAHAAVNNFTPLTWNSFGAKWGTVKLLAAGGPGITPHSVVAIQEAGPETSLQAAGATATGRTWTAPGQPTVTEYTMQAGTYSRGRQVYVYFMQTDPGANRVNLAMVTHTAAQNVLRVAPQPDNTAAHSLGRPSFGVQLDTQTVFWNVHAGSYGDNAYNDADNLLAAIATATQTAGLAQWSVLGDFNRNPTRLTLPAGATVYQTTGGTQQTGNQLDYMVSNQGNQWNQPLYLWGGRQLTVNVSDHLPVEFGFRFNAGAGQQGGFIRRGDNPAFCVSNTGTDWYYGLTTNPCGVQYEYGTQWFVFDGQSLKDTRTGECWDAKGRGTGNGTPVGHYTCNGQDNQKFVFRPDGTLYNPVSGRCVDSTAGQWTGHSGELVLYDCNTTTYPTNQQFILPWAGPVVRPTVTETINPTDGTITPVTDPNLNTPMCLDDLYGATYNGNPIYGWDCDTTSPYAHQWWEQGRTGTSNTLEFQGKCLAAIGAPTPGIPVVLYDCDGDGSEQWTLRADGSLFNPATGRCLQAPSRNQALAAVICVAGLLSQQWSIPK
ncbi:ricin-type beta-trefoil lectin domain protein [Streptomyces sp. MUM 136J]|uniref:ricin-type beta-trefoil lectin domain protein n=1 Tax=Streptomyces sp. MUM 136J TaxID=2791992 RepID=UPI001F03D2D9|nr:ricin-type beta-trefoil lectin domain protein [Streptomyces sp. MUM 136J]MCH0572758.1 ricin-type beta-trefoil lectin domain protein [Streptomyces sp. MUM 136J]